MSTVSIDCPCGKRLAVRKDLMGKRVRCPSCSAVLEVPSEAPPEVAELICSCGQPLSVPETLRGKRVCCPKCSQEIRVPERPPKEEVADPFAALDTSPAAASLPEPSAFQAYAPSSPAYQPPAQPPAQPAPAHQSPLRNPKVGGSKSQFRNYADVPWIRKSGTNSVFLILHLVTCGLAPFLLVTCVVLVTGHVYYNQKEASGNLKVWSVANTIVAFLLLIPTVLVLGTLLVGFFGAFLKAFQG